MAIKIKDIVTPKIREGKSVRVVGNLWKQAPLLPSGTFMVFLDQPRSCYDSERLLRDCTPLYMHEFITHSGVYLAEFNKYEKGGNETIPNYERFSINDFIYIGNPKKSSLKNPKTGNFIETTYVATNKYGPALRQFPMGREAYEGIVDPEEHEVNSIFFLGKDALAIAQKDKKYGGLISRLTKNVVGETEKTTEIDLKGRIFDLSYLLLK